MAQASGCSTCVGHDPRFKAINKQKLYRPEAGKPDAYPNLAAILTRNINWELIRQQYDQMIKYATALRLGTAETESILRRFTRNNLQHPTYFYCISSMHAGTCFLGITCVFYCFWHLRTAPTSKRRPETAESLEKARFSRECRKNGSFQGLKFPETIRFHRRNSSNDLSLDRGLIQ